MPPYLCPCPTVFDSRRKAIFRTQANPKLPKLESEEM